LCYDDYAVSISTGINSVPNPITGFYAGETLIVTITHLISGNSCWGTVTINDYLPPTFNCPTAPVAIYCTEDYQQVPPPVANENCTPVSYQLIDELVVDSDACDDGVVRIHRVWIAIDDYGNESNPCVQVLEINRPDDVDFPNDINWSCEQYAIFPSITNPVPLHPSVAALQNGTQTIDATDITSSSVLNNTGSGIPRDLDGQYCNYSYSHSDQLIASCGTTFKILRTWTVLDWCTNSVVTMNNQGEDNVQLITILDDEGPVVTLAPFTVSANVPGVHPQPCTSQDFLNPATVSDDCNSTTIKIFTPVGEAVYVNGTNGAAGGFIPAPGLPLGVHPIVYQAVDACGNTTELIVNVEVIDDITPTAICDEITEVSLSSNGQAVISASIFDDGSLDNCCIDHFEARRMEDNCGINGNLTFGPSVIFCCADVDDSPHLVQVRVFDCFDNYNECMVQVYVDDKLPPAVVFCPNTQTITCDQYQTTYAAQLAAGNYGVLDVFGLPTFYDNCEALVTSLVAVNVNACAEGTIQRTWTANDPAGNVPATCIQNIIVEHVSDWVVEFPADVSSTCVDGELPEFGEPEIFYDGCEMIGTSYDDMYFYIVPDACFKVIRTWTVVNWCIYDEFGYDAYAELSELDAGQDFDGDGDIDDRTFRDGVNNGPEADGYIVYIQVLKVIDEDAPEFEVSDMNVCILGTTCDTDVELPIPDVVDCSDDVTIEITSNMPNQVGNTNVYADVPPGTYTANYEVYDNCGNISYDAITIEVEDCKLPTPYCKAGLIVEIMQTGMVPVPATLINDNSFDNCPGDLQFSFSSDVNDDELIFDCDQLGQNFIELWVTDASGNQDFCETFIIVQDNMMHCTDNPMISGLIMTEVDAPVEDVNVDINSGLFSYLTDQNGMYFTSDLLPDNDYTVTPELNANPVNGVTTLDMVLIQLHILGLNPLDSPYKMIAADINDSGTITTLDLVVMQKVILLLLPDFPNNTSWRFIDSDYVFPYPSNPWYQPFPEVINYNNLNVVISDADFVAVKIGDVNHSATTTNLLGNDDRNLNPSVAFTTPAQKMERGEDYRIDIFAPEMEMKGCQFTLDFDTEAFRITEILPGIATADQIGTSRIEEGALTVSWYTEQAQNISAAPLFSLMVRAEKNGLLENNLRLNARLIAAEAYSKELNIHPLSLQFMDGTQAAAVYLYQNVPNPFHHDTRIGFHLPKAGPASLTILSVDGKVLKTVKGN
ncbi:MAG: hypothetical protein KDC44_11245, partial [Phaeodactylibacter sp.]|nr:hypothetical protein [Phaeodactylibacter sp.]